MAIRCQRRVMGDQVANIFFNINVGTVHLSHSHLRDRAPNYALILPFLRVNAKSGILTIVDGLGYLISEAMISLNCVPI
jgi:hypothetical protein